MEKGTETQAEKFYNSLREKDKEFVRETVNKLKKEGFDVYVAGSSLERKNYADIDIVIAPSEGMSREDALGGLERTTYSIPRVNIVDMTQDRKHYKDADFLPRDPDGPRYMGSIVAARHVLSEFLNKKPANPGTKTSIDMVLTYNPFEVRPEINRIKL